jgi:hypothetical protein
MEKVRDEVLETMLKDYKPLYRFLKEAEYESKLKVYGTFQVPKNWFYQGNSDFGHFTDTERVFCFNQMCYILFVEGFERGEIPDAPKLTMKEIYELQAHSSYLVESNNIKYTKPIVSTDPFKGKIEVANTFTKKDGEILFLDIAFDFEQGKATGQSRVCIILRDLQKRAYARQPG